MANNPSFALSELELEDLQDILEETNIYVVGNGVIVEEKRLEA